MEYKNIIKINFPSPPDEKFQMLKLETSKQETTVSLIATKHWLS